MDVAFDVSCEGVKDLVDDRSEEPQNLHLEVQKLADENYFFKCVGRHIGECVFFRD